MMLDAAKGIEAQTLKLFEVCRLRDMPIITFVNKLDRESRDPFELLDEIEQRLALDVTPASWPIGMGRSLLGCYDLLSDPLTLVERTRTNTGPEGQSCSRHADPQPTTHLPALAAANVHQGQVRAVT